MRFARIRLAAAIALGASLLFIAAWPVAAQIFGGQEITSSGPLTRIIVSDSLTCQVQHREDEFFELFGGEFGSCGTYLALGGNVYGPSGGNATGVNWTPVSQTLSGTRIDTVVHAGDTGLRLQQVDSYSVGQQSYRTDLTFTNTSAAPVSGIAYRAGDCYLQDDDTGFGRVDNGAPACIVDPAVGQRIEQWTSLTPGSHYMEAIFGEVYQVIREQRQFPDTCRCDEDVDNGAGLSWPLAVAPGQSVTISHETFFSPQGRSGGDEAFTASVPDPTQISLDPVVIASSVAITAGVIILVPFPSALFNNTLEENYDEVMAGLARLRAWLARQSAALRARIRRWRDDRRAQRAATASSSVAADDALAPPSAPTHEATSISDLAPTIQPQTSPAEEPPSLYAPLATSVDRDVWRTPLGMLGFICLSALLYAFLDPTFGVTVTSLATFLGLAIGLFIVLLAYGVPLMLFSRTRGLSMSVRALPVTLIIGLVCVLISRLVSFQPGYLYGLIIGFFFVHAVPRDVEGRAEAIAAAASLVAALVAWITLAFLRGTPAGEADAFFNSLLQAASVTIVVAGLENAVFAMLPLRFMPGAAVYGWNRVVWVVLIGLGLFGFAHVLLNPSAGYLADTTRTSFFTLVLLLIAFGLASVLFWAYFRFRPKRSGSAVTS
jgi:hypothetical protein